MQTLVQQLLDRVLEGHPRPLKISFQVQPPSFHNPFSVPLRPPEQNNAAAIAEAIERLNEISGAGIDLLSGTTLCKVQAVWPLLDNRTNQGKICRYSNKIFMKFKVHAVLIKNTTRPSNANP